MSTFLKSVAAAGLAPVVLFLIACGGPQAQAPATSTPAASSNPSAALVVTLTDPPSGAFSGHIDSFRWSPVEGADGYRMRITGGDGRVVWESAVLTTAEVHLPPSVSIEPESYFWQVTATKGTTVLASSALSKFTITP